MKQANRPVAEPSGVGAADVPADLVSMGYIAGAFGIRGWVKVVADTEYSDSLLDYDTWWVGRDGAWHAYRLEEGQVQPKNLNAKLAGVEHRDAAFALKGLTVAVPRSQMPEAAENEYYWADLIGLSVVNLQGETLGTVKQLLSTGANDVLVVNDGATERLLPFVSAIVIEVDRVAQVIKVDWGLDY